MSNDNILPGSTGGQHQLAGLIDHTETYGTHIIEALAGRLTNVCTVVDIGAGSGRDLAIVKSKHAGCKTIALEAGKIYAGALASKVDEVFVLDIERDPFPFEDNSVDLFIANQILEHTKEVFWIFDQISRSLRVGGSLIIGVPNVLSLHNRIIGLFGVHPTQHKLYSAHVRPFSKKDTIRFVEVCSPGTFEVSAFKGSQFYPFPKSLSRMMATALPSMAFSIFFHFTKVGPYNGGFVKHPAAAGLETNFFVGSGPSGQY